MSREAMQMALKALVENDNYLGSLDFSKEIAALRQALANQALDKMAENARELGLDYEPAGGTQVSKVWWDGDKLIAKPIPLSEVYKEPEQQPAAQCEKCKEWEAVCDQHLRHIKKLKKEKRRENADAVPVAGWLRAKL